MNSHIITPGPYRATKLWNEITRLFRAGMPLKKHRQNLRNYSNCFTALAAVDWLHQMLCNNSNFGPDVTRQQTVQLLKKFLKNHVIEDVKGRWGTEDLEENNTLYRFPATSPLKPVPCPPIPSVSKGIKKKSSLRDKEGFFRFKSMKKNEQEENRQIEEDIGEHVQRRELTGDDEQNIWRDTTLIHLQKILGIETLDAVLDHCSINPQNIIHNVTKVNTHGVVTLDDKTGPKYDSAQPSYPGFERDVFKMVSDYFYSLPQPLLTYELYELFINILVYCGYVAEPTVQQGKRKKHGHHSAPPPAKTSFRSTECLLLSLLRQRTCEETDSPMTEVLGGKVQSSHLALLKGTSISASLSGSYMSLSTAGSLSQQSRSFSLETIVDDSTPLTRKPIFLSNDSLASCSSSIRSQESNWTTTHNYSDFTSASRKSSVPFVNAPHSFTKHSVPARRMHNLRPKSVGSCLDVVVETNEENFMETKWQGRTTSCLNVNISEDQHHSHVATIPLLPSVQHHANFSSLASNSCSLQTTSEASGPQLTSTASNLWSAPAAVRRCFSSLEMSTMPQTTSLSKPSICVPTARKQHHKQQFEHRLPQPQAERVAIEALQLCTLLLPPSSRRKLQLLMRMMSRISQNVDMPLLHPAIGTRTLMVHTFSGCVLGSAEEGDLDELLATRLVSFLLDHQKSILSVPEYLVSAINDHVEYLRMAQVPIDDIASVNTGDAVCAPLPMYTFCRQISGDEFEQQKLSCSQKAMEDLLETLMSDQNMTEKDRRKKLKQFQKQYPDIYSQRFPSTEKVRKADNKPKIKAPLLIRKNKTFGIRN